MKNYIHYLCGLALAALTVSMASPSAAQTESAYGSAYRESGGEYPYVNKNPYPVFKTTAAPRQEDDRNYYAAAWGGINFFQNASPAVRDNYHLGIEQDLSLKDSTDFAVGAKIGYIWRPKDLTFYGKKSELTILPSIEGEMLYTKNSGSKLSWDRSFNGTASYGSNSVSGNASAHLAQKFSMDIYAFTVNPILRVQWGIFRPYVGFGIGGAYVEAKNTSYELGVNGDLNVSAPDYPEYSGHHSGNTSTSLPGSGSQSQWAFCFQGIAGTDIFLTKEWSLFVEYKFLGLVALEFDKALYGAATYDMGSVYGNHLAVVGVKFHY